MFIRAPLITEVGPDVDVLATYQMKSLPPARAAARGFLSSSGADRCIIDLHAYFLDMVREAERVRDSKSLKNNGVRRGFCKSFDELIECMFHSCSIRRDVSCWM